MPYAAEGVVSQSQLTGGIEITEYQYRSAINAQLDGGSIAIRGGQLRVLSTGKRVVYSTSDKSVIEIAENDDTPAGYTDAEPGPWEYWDGAKWSVNSDLKLLSEKASMIDEILNQRKSQEVQGVTINGIRYAGDPSNRQAIAESIDFMTDAGANEFISWKDSDGVFHADHPLTDVIDAYRAIGVRRVQLIAAEGQYAVQVQDGTMTDLSEVVWP